MKVVKISQVKEETRVTPLFTGPVKSQALITDQMSKQFIINQVSFGKGVKNKFHAHTSEQVLIVTKGKGIVATEKEQVEVEPGTVIIFPAGEKHWHGATKNSDFSHITVASPGSTTTQFEK